MSQPPYEPPNQPPPMPPGYAAPPPGGQPRKGRAGLIIGLAVAGLLVIAGILVVALVVGGDDDSAGGDESPSSTESDEPTEEPTPEDQLLQGSGYAFEMPDEWQDITAEVAADNAAATIDSAISWGDSIATGRANLIVEVTSAGGVTDLDVALDQLTTNMESLGAPVETIDDRDIDGQTFAGVTLTRTNEFDVEIEQTAYITIRDDTAYVITTSNESDDAEPENAFDDILASWAWE